VVEEPQTVCEVKIIVDANIVFSAILNTSSKIGDLLINSKGYFEFIAPNFLQAEIYKHYPKLAKISGMTLEEVREAEAHVCEEIHFISEEQIRDLFGKPRPTW
jgi:predicted nucleic acid-binding protein